MSPYKISSRLERLQNNKTLTRTACLWAKLTSHWPICSFCLTIWLNSLTKLLMNVLFMGMKIYCKPLNRRRTSTVSLSSLQNKCLNKQLSGNHIILGTVQLIFSKLDASSAGGIKLTTNCEDLNTITNWESVLKPHLHGLSPCATSGTLIFWSS